MPAVELAFSETVPDQRYLATDFITAGLIDTEPHHARARTLWGRAGETGTVLYLYRAIGLAPRD